MKRSEINAVINDAKQFFEEYRFRLPPWAYYTLPEWQDRAFDLRKVMENGLGWDITDFGSGNYRSRGLFLFTLRNGNLKTDVKPYAEKIMIVDVDQETPRHFHFHKMEDIINRGGGRLVIELYGSTKEGGLSDEPVETAVDGVRRKIAAGGRVVLEPGESICLVQGMYHRFWAEGSRVLTGEVSMTNDDKADNRFHEPIGRFPRVEENEAILHPLVSDYETYLK